MPCILLPAGSNPTPTTQPTKCARSRKGAGVFCCACLSSATVISSKGLLGSPGSLRYTFHSLRILLLGTASQESKILRSLQSNFARKPPRTSLRECFGSPGSLRYNLTLTPYSTPLRGSRNTSFVPDVTSLANLLVHSPSELRSPVRIYVPVAIFADAKKNFAKNKTLFFCQTSRKIKLTKELRSFFCVSDCLGKKTKRKT